MSKDQYNFNGMDRYQAAQERAYALYMQRLKSGEMSGMDAYGHYRADLKQAYRDWTGVLVHAERHAS